MRSLSTGAEFYKFTDNAPIFIGKFLSPHKREKDSDEKGPDGKPKHLAGSIMGYDFEDEEGTVVIIGASHAVEKSMEQVKEGEIIGFKFLGKTTNKNNQPVNRFKIDAFESWDEAEKHYYPEAAHDGNE